MVRLSSRDASLLMDVLEQQELPPEERLKLLKEADIVVRQIGEALIDPSQIKQRPGNQGSGRADTPVGGRNYQDSREATSVRLESLLRQPPLELELAACLLRVFSFIDGRMDPPRNMSP